MIDNKEYILYGKSNEKFSPIFSDKNLHGILLGNSLNKKI